MSLRGFGKNRNTQFCSSCFYVTVDRFPKQKQPKERMICLSSCIQEVLVHYGGKDLAEFSFHAGGSILRLLSGEQEAERLRQEVEAQYHC